MKGFSLLELLLVLAVLGLILALGLPRLNPDAQAVNQAARGLAEQVVRARLEAIRQNAPAGLQVFTEGAGGYAAFLDRNANGAYDPGEEIQVVRFGEGPWARVRLAPERSALGNLPLLFDARGVPAKPIATTIALTDPPGRHLRKVVVSQAGRARLE